MNLDDEELAKTKSVKRAYDVVYRNMEYYIDRYNELENEIQNNYYSKEKILQALEIEYREQDLSEDRICSLIESLLKEKRRVEKELEKQAKSKVTEQEIAYYEKLLKFIIDDRLLEKGLEINEKNEARTIQAYKDHLRKAENKVTEKELKDMILGMLE